MLITKICSYLLIGIIVVFHTSTSQASNKNSTNVTDPSSTISSFSFLLNQNSSSSTRNKDRNNFKTIICLRRKRSEHLPIAQQWSNLANFPASARFNPGPGKYSNWPQQKYYWRPASQFSSVPAAPTMRYRTPRFTFRVNDYPVVASGNDFYQPYQSPDAEKYYIDPQNQLFNEYPSLESESRKEKTPMWKGDDSLCAAGRSCEFFLTCWMSAGLLDGSCGGIMYACCRRPKDEAKASNDYNYFEPESRDQIQSLATDSYDLSAAEPADNNLANDDQCGISATGQTAQRRIVGGDEAGFGKFPWQAYLIIGPTRCGGSLVNRFHVVTAGHCVAKVSPRQVRVILGDYVLNSATESLPAYTFRVQQIILHPYFRFKPQADRFDVAILRLDRPVNYMPHISPICLPESNEDFTGQHASVAGWGAVRADSKYRPSTLQATTVPVIHNRVCESWHYFVGINIKIYDEMMCAGYRRGGRDSCQGDSGGPLMLEKSGKWHLIGIVSAGYKCGEHERPGIYHRVTDTVDWIKHVINS